MVEGDVYNLNQVGYNGKGYCFTSTTRIPDNEAFLGWENGHTGFMGLPATWPTNEWYVSFWVRYPTFTSMVSHENIKLFYPKWDGGDSHSAFDDTGQGSLYHSEKSNGVYVTNSNWVKVAGINNGAWHHVEFYMDFEKGISRFWYDGNLAWDKNWGPGTFTTPVKMYYFTFGSIDASGDSIFNRQFDEIEVWDGMPGTLICTESWTCSAWTNWNTCTNNLQSHSQTCIDANSCGTTTSKPITTESQACTSVTTYNLTNFTQLVTDWLKAIASSPADVNKDGKVNSQDLGIMMSNWQN